MMTAVDLALCNGFGSRYNATTFLSAVGEL